MATFTWAPDYSSQEERKPRVRKIQFGDGYSQRSSDGINTGPSVWSVAFANRADGEASAIKAFLAAREGREAFDWTPPGGSAGKYLCETWRSSPVNFGATTISATFSEVFEP